MGFIWFSIESYRNPIGILKRSYRILTVTTQPVSVDVGVLQGFLWNPMATTKSKHHATQASWASRSVSRFPSPIPDFSAENRSMQT